MDESTQSWQVEARRPRIIVVMAVLLVVALVLVALGARWWHGVQRRERGQAIFEGSADLSGRLAGHSMPLPRLATRCMNCHETVDAAPAASAASVSASTSTSATATATALATAAAEPVIRKTLATPLNRVGLSTRQSRHGGPPTRYDIASLCRLLRRGVDAGQVVISTVMPRYDALDAQCADLHAYLVSR